MTEMIPWCYLILAIFTEVASIISMKLSDGFNYVLPSLLIFIFYTVSLIFLALSLKRFEVGFAYAVWSAIGTLLIFVIGICYFHESVTLLQTLSLSFIIVGVIGLEQT